MFTETSALWKVIKLYTTKLTHCDHNKCESNDDQTVQSLGQVDVDLVAVKFKEGAGVCRPQTFAISGVFEQSIGDIRNLSGAQHHSFKPHW